MAPIAKTKMADDKSSPASSEEKRHLRDDMKRFSGDGTVEQKEYLVRFLSGSLY